MREMLNPFRHGTFALKLWSHKLLRWWIPAMLVGLLILNLLLLGVRPVYGVLLMAQAAFYLLALGGFFGRHKAYQPVLLRVPFYFCLVNIAAGIGLIEAFDGKSYTTWTTARTGG
jgi:hypothetical protein